MKLQDVPLRCIFLQLLVAAANLQDLPYNPTSIFLSDKNAATKDIAYVFLPTASNSQHYLAALNVSSTLSATNLSLETITATLPFLSDDSIAFIPSISSTGEIAVYAGSCATSTSSALWRFTPSNTSASGNGTWARESTSTASRVTSTDLPGADFLSKGFTFSTLVSANASQTGIYIFGGMCPTNSSTTSTWQSAASYSNHMLRLSPESTSGSITSYTLDLPTSNGPPIPEAGFTITGLSPTYSNGSGVMTQSQNFILLGGHTETAFINMSQVAIWSLPEDTWSFVTIDSPSSDSANTELTVKSTAKRTVTSIDSRSGHTAVLSEDGARIIVFGGWVGDVSQAADPQLAVLELGTGFGGSGDWIWSVPEKQPSGPGIYGHGAAMLPGNVMMVLGGYNVSTSSSKRAETSSATSNPSFFNATSMSWISDYANPAYVAAIANQASSSPASRTYAKKVGLGAGLGLGFAAIIAAIAIYCWYSKRLKRKRLAEREKDIGALGLGTADYYSYYPNRDMGARGGGMFPWANGRWNGNDRDEHVYDSTSGIAGYENLNTGVHGVGDNGNIPTPSNRQIPRKPLNPRNAARGLYQATPTFDPAPGHTRSNSLGTAGPIHPIYEADEDLDHPGQYASGGVGVALGDPSDPTPAEPNQKKVYRFSDPFRDPPTTNVSGSVRNSNRSTSTPSPEISAREREREVSEWISDWDAADALLHQQTKYHSTAGRLSPTKRAQLIAARDAGYNSEDDSGRTTSNISEHSIAVSALTVSRSGSSSQGRSRSDSLRGFINTAIHPFSSTAGSNTVLSETFDRTGPSDPRAYPVPSSAGSGTTSFNTAPTSFIELQAQAESLLPRPDDHVTSPDDSPTRAYPESPTRDYYIEPPGSPSKNKGLLLGRSRTQGGWLGSLRRVFVGESGSNRTGYAEPFSTHHFSAERSSAGLDPVIGAAGVEPRRTVSAGATLWRRKQGKVDWQDSAEPFDAKQLANAQRSATITGNTGPPHFHLPGVESSTRTSTDEDEWDIEKAVERRVVQVMFTVPKEKLRVVNHDVIEDLSDVASLKSRQGSQKEKEAETEVEGSENAIGVQVPEAPRDIKGKGKEVDRPKSKVLEMVESFEAKSRPNSPARSVTPGR